MAQFGWNANVLNENIVIDHYLNNLLMNNKHKKHQYINNIVNRIDLKVLQKLYINAILFHEFNIIEHDQRFIYGLSDK